MIFDILDYKGAAEAIGVPPCTVRSLVFRKQIPHYRISKRIVRFKRAELEQWLRDRMVAPLIAVPGARS